MPTIVFVDCGYSNDIALAQTQFVNLNSEVFLMEIPKILV
jgi:hypothetical protein